MIGSRSASKAVDVRIGLLAGTRRWSDTARGALPVLLLAAVMAGSGCSAPEAPTPDAAASVDQRRERFRDRLRDSLGDRYDSPIPAPRDDDLRHGSNRYDLLCKACHGSTGKGNGKSTRLLMIEPPDLSDPDRASFFSDRAKLRIIAEGIDGTPMIGWSDMLNEEERIAVLHFMNTLIREPQSP